VSRGAASCAILVLALTSCARSPQAGSVPERTTSATSAGDNATYDTSLPLKEFMGHVMQHAGDGIWARQGTIIDERGEHDLFPKNDREWENAESASLLLAELTNVLLLPGRRIDEPQWTQAAARVRAVARRAAAAAENKDRDAFFAAGGELDAACESCHVRYIPELAAAQAATQRR
jgi:hypothetical protein